MPITTFPTSIEVPGYLDGTTGFRIDGETAADYSSYSVNIVGDINGDGFDDIIIGAYGADPEGKASAGVSYVIFGKKTWDAAFNISALDGTNGFKILGEVAGDKSGIQAKGAGDFNGDGFDDLIIGAHTASPHGKDEAGSSYIIFGHDDIWNHPFELSSLNGVNGFKINGVAAGDKSGRSVNTAGDVNNDGFTDIIIGSPWADPGGKTSAGSSYVIFGHNETCNHPFELSSLNGAHGFKINGEETYDYSGYAVSNVGDVNNDGFDDILIGAVGVDYHSNTAHDGSSYLVFGKNSWGSSLELSSLNGMNGVKFAGGIYCDYSGVFISAIGDFNGDGINDFIIGSGANGEISSYYYIANNARVGYVVFGREGIWNTPVELSDLDGSSGFKIDNRAAATYYTTEEGGTSPAYYFEHHTVSVGDINGDGRNDLIIGSPWTHYSGENIPELTYVLFGKQSAWESSIDLNALDPTEGFKIVSGTQKSGVFVGQTGDINGDGIDDLVIGSPYADPDDQSAAGSSYIIFGKNVPPYFVMSEGGLFYSENDPAIIIDSGLTLKDPDSFDVYNATVAITSHFNKEQDILSFVDQQGISGFYHNDTGILLLTGKASVENYQTALRSITYQNRGDNPTDIPRVISFTASDGSKNSLSGIRVINIMSINDAPTLAPSITEVNYIEKEFPQVICPTLNITDSHNKNLAGVTVTITTHFDNDQDILSFTNQNGIVGTYIQAMGKLTLMGKASPKSYQTALRNVTYHNPSLNPTVGTRVISIVANDGSDDSTPVTALVNIVPINDAPVMAGGGGTLTYTEQDPATVINAGLSVSDPDSSTFTNATVAITNNFVSGQDILGFTDQNGITGEYNSTNGVLLLSGMTSVTDYQTALREVTYANTADTPNIATRTVSFSVNDGDKDSNILTKNIVIESTNDTPVLVNNQLTITEGHNVTLTTNELSATDSDDPDEDLIFTVSNIQYGSFFSKRSQHTVTQFQQKNVTQGDIQFIHTGEEHTPNYWVSVSDGHSDTSFQAPDPVIFTPENDPPVLEHNTLTINQGKTAFVGPTELKATDEETAAEDLLFIFSAIQHGVFENIYAPGTYLSSCLQRSIMDMNIRFVHDGSENAPSYAIVVNDGSVSTDPKSAAINFFKTDPTQIINSGGDNSLKDKIIGGAAGGFVSLCFLVIKLYLNHKATQKLKKFTEDDEASTMKKQAEFRKNILRPIAKEIFDRINIKGFMGYISDDTMRKYLDSVFTIIENLENQGVNIDLVQMNAMEQTRLVDEIAKQTKAHLLPEQACFSCGHFYHFFKSFFVPDVSSQEIKEKVPEISSAVQKSLVQRHHVVFRAHQVEPDDIDIKIEEGNHEIEPEPVPEPSEELLENKNNVSVELQELDRPSASQVRRLSSPM